MMTIHRGAVVAGAVAAAAALTAAAGMAGAASSLTGQHDMETPAPTRAAAADKAAPRFRALTAATTRRAVRVRFRLSETATVTARVQRKGVKRVLAHAHVQAPAGKRALTLRLRSKLARGAYRITLQARDAAGNRSSAAKTVKAGR